MSEAGRQAEKEGCRDMPHKEGMTEHMFMNDTEHDTKSQHGAICL